MAPLQSPLHVMRVGVKCNAVYKQWSSTSQIPRWNYAVLTFVLGCFGILMLAEGVGSYVIARRASQWPKTQAAVTVSSVIGTHLRSRFMEYFPKVTYSFTVDDRVYQGTRVDYTKRYTDASSARKAYHDGHGLPIHYEPGNPANSFAPGMERSVVAGSVTLGMFLLAISLFTFVRWRECRGQQG